MGKYVLVTDASGEPLEVQVTLPDGRIAITGVFANTEIVPHADIPGDVAQTIRGDLRAAADAKQSAEIQAAVAVAVPAPTPAPTPVPVGA